MRSEGLTIGELARRSGVKLETIRYYERIGILAAPPRTKAGHRVYGRADEKALLAIRHARELGFTLAEIRILLPGRGGEEVRCSQALEIAARNLERVRVRIAHLARIESLLAKATALCSGGPDQDCPIVEMLTRLSSGAELNGFVDRS